MSDETKKSIPKPYQKRPAAENPTAPTDTPSVGDGKTIPSRVHRDIEWPI